MAANKHSITDTSKAKTSVAVLWLNYGPYHVARARALAKRHEFDCHFVELTGTEETHPWAPLASPPEFKLLTLSRHGLPSGRAAQIVTHELNRLNPDIVVSSGYGLKEMRAAARWARREGKLSILTFETTRRDRSRYWGKEWLKSLLVRRYYDAAFVGGSLHRTYLEELGMHPGRIFEPYDVVDNNYFESSAANTRSLGDCERRRLRLPARYFLYVGRYAPEKNLFRLLRAYGIYRSRYPNGWALVLVGEGPENRLLQQLASELCLPDVVWASFKQIDELPAHYALAHCFILPSTSEPWGLVVNEAMACGLPVLVSNRCGCAPDLVRTNENGFLFDPHSVDEIAELLHKVSLFSELQLRQMGMSSRSIISRYTPEIFARNLTKCLRAVVGEKTFNQHRANKSR